MRVRLGLVMLSMVVLGAFGCASEDDGGDGFGGMGGAGGGGAGGVGGMGGVGGGGAGGAGGMGGAAGMVSGGVGAGGGAGGMGGTGGSDPTMCGAGYKCQTIGAQMLCSEEATSQPPMCTMGGTECAALAGSVCTMLPGLGNRCLKTCGTPMMMGCP